MALCNAALAFTYELRAATSVERACASRLSYWMTKKLVEAPTSNLAYSAESDSSCNGLHKHRSWERYEYCLRRGFDRSCVTSQFAEKPLEFCSCSADQVGVGCERHVGWHVRKHPRIELLPQEHGVDGLQP